MIESDTNGWNRARKISFNKTEIFLGGYIENSKIQNPWLLEEKNIGLYTSTFNI